MADRLATGLMMVGLVMFTIAGVVGWIEGAAAREPLIGLPASLMSWGILLRGLIWVWRWTEDDRG